MVVIPVKFIDTGIKSCLNNAESILESNLYIMKHQMFHTVNLELVLYYYALEEYGKSIKLKQDKDIAIKKKNNTITPKWWKNHDLKIKAVREKHNSTLDIPNKGILSFNKGKIHVTTIKRKDLLINNFYDRSNFLLTDYDENRKKWGSPMVLKTSETISTKTKLLKREVRRFRRELFGKS